MQPDSEGSSSPRPPSARPVRGDARGVSPAGSWRTIQVRENAPSLLGYLERQQALPLSLAHRWIRTGLVLVNGLRVSPKAGLSAGDTLRLPSILVGRRPEGAVR
ncbi:MAG: hypothetical protein Q4F72_02875 [Desulfovibrionaceae bacterium]|nr:hypothetical protein [Desulfovibrionaceae bacterium]